VVVLYLPVDAHPALTFRPDNALVALPSFQLYFALYENRSLRLA